MKKRKKREEKFSDETISAYHEAGHAVVQRELQPDQPVKRLKLLPAKYEKARGGTAIRSLERKHWGKTEALNYMCMCYGGRAAEAVCLEKVFNGSHDDLISAHKLARSFVIDHGFSSILPDISLLEHLVIDSERLRIRVEDETHRILRKQYSRAKSIIRRRRKKIQQVV